MYGGLRLYYRVGHISEVRALRSPQKTLLILPYELRTVCSACFIVSCLEPLQYVICELFLNIYPEI